MEKQQNIQDGFLNSARKEKTLVTIYLVSGAKLTGRIRSFDKYSVVLESSNQEQLIFKHAISTVVLPRSGYSAAPSTQASAGSPAAAPAAAPPGPSATPAETRREG
ncbi:MAG TPA: RNA chaperone Hfq [Terriglobia bacterium]|nr:RNA chaperone Hfq [Terriglobia bacterium]